ncbi:MAG: hypothetical protein HY852_14350 [Bradyrhizobium sp.]|uniref:hypothetical protein n=1 Tax=Bradyrhizobium sp. TaxID=376 RepID=UPI0025BD714E|nr:hypothetical protein [Bradyrhizobium sp.]MBI5262990.1 hypothetical protein [Bradyrhizobium sp.]
MPNERFPNDPYPEDDFARAARRDANLQPDPELAEGPASPGRIALYAIAIALVLGAVFYGLNQSNVEQASTAPPAQTAQQQSAKPAAPGTSNTQPGTTTGSAPSGAQPASPPSNSGPNPTK